VWPGVERSETRSPLLTGARSRVSLRSTPGYEIAVTKPMKETMMETVTFKVEGMTCGGCVASVTRVLKAVAGVDDVAVTLTPGAARVTFDPVRTNPPALRAAIEDAGYGVAA
jgi:copper chaperone